MLHTVPSVIAALWSDRCTSSDLTLPDARMTAYDAVTDR
jgi:hypothetical protein